MITRKHFKAIAAILATYTRATTPLDINEVIFDFANLLADTNPRFDRQRFLEACWEESRRPAECPGCNNLTLEVERLERQLRFTATLGAAQARGGDV